MRVEEYNRLMESHVSEQRAITSGTTRELFESNPQLNDTLAKIVLVDSRGQHKNERNAQRAIREHGPLKLSDVNCKVVESGNTLEVEDEPLEALY
jgi:hypothetical protein